MNEFTKEFIEKLRTFNKNILDNELSIQHPFLNMHTSVFMSALDEIQRLQSRVQELEAEQSEITQAFGLLTTLCPTMEIDTSDYMGMAKKIEEHVQKLEAEQRWIPVSERLPEDSRIYDVAIAGYQY